MRIILYALASAGLHVPRTRSSGTDPFHLYTTLTENNSISNAPHAQR
jgi:hypothetical protein